MVSICGGLLETHVFVKACLECARPWLGTPTLLAYGRLALLGVCCGKIVRLYHHMGNRLALLGKIV